MGSEDRLEGSSPSRSSDRIWGLCLTSNLTHTVGEGQDWSPQRVEVAESQAGS